MARVTELIINTKDAERKIKQVHESVILATNAMDHLISVITEATKALQEYQKVAGSLFLKDEGEG